MKNLLARRSAWTWLLVAALGVAGGCRTKPPVDFTHPYLDARSILRQSAEDPDPEVRTKALEALAATEGADAGMLMMQALQDEHLPVRFAAAMAVGDVRYEPASPLLHGMAKDSQTPPKLLCAIVYALHRMGDFTYTSELGRLLFHRDDKWVRATAAMVMGRLGEPGGKQPLDNLRRESDDPVVQLAVVEALAALGDTRCITLLRAFTRSRFMEDRIIAVQGLGRVRNPGSVYFLRKLVGTGREDPAVRMAAAGSLAQLGEVAGYKLALRAATDPEKVLRSSRGRNVGIRPGEVSNLQTLAVLALGRMGNTDAIETLHPLALTRQGAVRVAACGAILQLLKGYQPRLEAPPAEDEPLPPVPEVPSEPQPGEPPEPTVAPPTPAPDTQPAPPDAESVPAPTSQPASQPTAPGEEQETQPAGEPATQPASQPALMPTAPPGFHTSGAKD